MLSSVSIWRGRIVGAALVPVLLFAASPARSAQSFDGTWSVLIVTDYGSCDRAYRYGVQIANGRVLYDGASGVDVSGTVGSRGQMNVTVRAGDQQASGSGRLSGVSGTGRWSGASPGQLCGGHWTAERRG